MISYNKYIGQYSGVHINWHKIQDDRLWANFFGCHVLLDANNIFLESRLGCANKDLRL